MNQPASDANRIETGVVIPNAQTPRVLGVLNIVFAGLLLFWAYTTAYMLMFAPVGSKLIQAWQANLERTIASQRDSQIRRLERQAQQAATELEKAEYAQRVAELRSQPVPNLGSMSIGFEQIEDPFLRGYSWADTATSGILNTLMLISGIGLLRVKEWGRKLAIGVASLKLLRLAVIGVVSIVWIYPLQASLTQKQLDEMQRQNAAQAKVGRAPAPMPFNNQQMTQLMAVSSSASGLTFLVGAAVYPVILIYLLTRVPVRAACRLSSGSITAGKATGDPLV